MRPVIVCNATSVDARPLADRTTVDRPPPPAVQEALRCLVVSVAVAVVVAFDPRDYYIGDRPKYVVLLAGAAAAAVLLVAAGALTAWRRNPLRWPVLALVVWTAVSAALSLYPRTALFGDAGSYDGLTTAVSLAVVFFATVAAFRPADVRGAVEVICLGAGAAVLLFGAAQALDSLVSPDTGWDWARPGIASHTIGSTLGNPNHLAALLAMLLPLAAVLAVRAGAGRRRRLVVGGIALALVEVAITVSRGGWLALLAAAAVLGALTLDRLRAHRSNVALVLTATVVLMAVSVVVLGAAGVTKIEPGALAQVGPGSTLHQRVEVWDITGRMWADRPITGVGPDVYTRRFPAYATDGFRVRYGPFTVANGAHNVFLNTLAGTGLVGLVVFLAVLATAARHLVRGWRRLPGGDDRLLLAGIAAALVAYVVQACLNTQTLPLTTLFWLLVGMGIALTSGGAGERS